MARFSDHEDWRFDTTAITDSQNMAGYHVYPDQFVFGHASVYTYHYTALRNIDQVGRE